MQRQELQKLRAGIVAVPCIAFLLFITSGCASSPEPQPASLSPEMIARSDLSRSCLNVVRSLKKSYPDARIQHEILGQDGLVRCRIQMDKIGHFFFSIAQPPQTDSTAYGEYETRRDEFRESHSATGSRYIPSGQSGTCFWNSSGYMAKLQLRWPSLGGDQCTIGNAPPPLQRGYELIKGQLSFPEKGSGRLFLDYQFDSWFAPGFFGIGKVCLSGYNFARSELARNNGR